MGLPCMRSPRRPSKRAAALGSALALGWIMATVGCQVEYAGMTLPSGRYMHDDVQYFPSGPDFPWANTQAATQRARMRAMGIEPPPPPGVAPTAPGALDASQTGPRGPNVNTMPMGVQPGQPVIPQPVPAGAGVVPGLALRRRCLVACPRPRLASDPHLRLVACRRRRRWRRAASRAGQQSLGFGSPGLTPDLIASVIKRDEIVCPLRRFGLSKPARGLLVSTRAAQRGKGDLVAFLDIVQREIRMISPLVGEITLGLYALLLAQADWLAI